jgi:hypothetical protein
MPLRFADSSRFDIAGEAASNPISRQRWAIQKGIDMNFHVKNFQLLQSLIIGGA